MKKNIPTPLADQYLDSVQQIKDAETDPFFYTRLKARMEKEAKSSGWNFPLKPVWLVSMLILFLFINTVFLVTQVKQTKEVPEQSTLQNFASGYDLSVSTSF